jgi:hypothetical protein
MIGKNLYRVQMSFRMQFRLLLALRLPVIFYPPSGDSAG